MNAFTYTAHPARVIFGPAERVADEAERLGLSRVLILCGPLLQEAAATIAASLGDRCAGIFAGAAMHTPVAVTEQAMRIVQDRRVDGLVAVGGGSAIGLSKAIALRTDLIQIAIPTTYAGSEMTPILGETANGKKDTRSTPRVLPEVVVYDVTLTMELPTELSLASGFNAIAHAVEALYAKEANPIVDMLAAEGVRSLVRGLPGIAIEPANVVARSDALYGAWLCGTCLGLVGMSLHHKLCHAIGGTFDLPHAETHCAILPHALQYNAPAAPGAMAILAGILDDPMPARALYDLAGALRVPRALRDLGMPEEGIDRATDLAMANAYWNPRPLERASVRDCIAAAWSGTPPRP